MLLYGNVSEAKKLEMVPGILIYSFTSFSERYHRLGFLIPPNYIGGSSEMEFDFNYMKYILEVDQVFYQFFGCIILPLDFGQTVFLCTSDNEWSDLMIESLLKLIQQRYGYCGTKIDSDDDFYSANESEFDPGYGLMNLDADRERYAFLEESDRLRRGGKPYTDDGDL